MSGDALEDLGLAAIAALLGLRIYVRCRRIRQGGAARGLRPRGGDHDGLPLNTVRMQRVTFLRVATRYDIGLHLAMETDVGAGRAAQPAGERRRRRRQREFAPYDAKELIVNRWTTRTMCGLAWSEMATHAFEVALVANHADYMCRGCSDAVARGEGMLRKPRASS